MAFTVDNLIRDVQITARSFYIYIPDKDQREFRELVRYCESNK